MSQLVQLIRRAIFACLLFAPTLAQAQQAIPLDAARKALLAESLKQPKFEPDERLTFPDYYAGHFPKDDRRIVSGIVDAIPTTLLSRDTITKAEFFEISERAWNAFPKGDTEDRERFMYYVQKLMDILEIESSDGRLNRWLYGFDIPSAQ